MRIAFRMTSADKALNARVFSWRRKSALGVFLAVGLLFVHEEWPNRYRHLDVRRGERTTATRVDRLTNETPYLGGGWKR